MSNIFNSKLATLLFTKELSSRLEGTGVTCNAVYPGAADTDFWNTIEDSYKNCKLHSLNSSCAKTKYNLF